MKHYQINIESKNKKSLENFFLFFLKNLKRYNLLNKYSVTKKKRKILTILKSPHIYKTAQEQFQAHNYSKNINIYLTQNSIFLLFIKKINLNLFSDVKIKIKFPINNKLVTQTKIKIFNNSNFKTNLLNNSIYVNQIKQKNLVKSKQKNLVKSKQKNLVKSKNKPSYQKITQLLKLLDIYGEFCKLNTFKSSK